MTAIFGKLKGDKVIWMVVILLSVFSLLAVYSSTGTLAYKYKHGNTEYYMMKHLIILLFGFLLMYLAHRIRYTYYSRFFQIGLYISAILLVITLFVGLELNDAKRLLPLPFNLTFQPSDLAKLMLITYLARVLTLKQDKIKDFRSAFLPVIVPVLAICLLILPANFSTSAILFMTSLVLMFIGRISMKHILAMIGIGVVSLAMVYLVYTIAPDTFPRFGTWKSRLENFFGDKDPEANYQVEQAKIAIASGGLLGKMPGNSDQRNFLPHPYSDFIFAIIVEEYGIMGGSLVVMLYLILLYRAVKIVARCPRNFGAFLAIGVAFSLVFQAMINMGVAVNLLPVTGQTLPLISMGGTSIWFTSLAIGIILSVSRDLETQEVDVEPALQY